MGCITGTATATITIATSTTVSGAFYVGSKVPVSIRIPAAITGANLSFQGSPDGVAYQQLYLAGAAYSVPVTASKDVFLNASVFAGFPFLKVVSDGAEAANRSFTVITRAGDR